MSAAQRREQLITIGRQLFADGQPKTISLNSALPSFGRLGGTMSVTVTGPGRDTLTVTRAAGVVVATGLANPRGIVVAPDGALFVAEAGLSGTEQFTPQPYPASTRGASTATASSAPCFPGRSPAISRR